MSNTNCSVHGCNNTQKNTKGITPKVRFFCFPSKPQDKVRKSKWILFCRRINKDGSKWEPTKNSRICSQHFVNNQHFNHPYHPSYAPTIFNSASRSNKNDSRYELYKFLQRLYCLSLKNSFRRQQNRTGESSFEINEDIDVPMDTQPQCSKTKSTKSTQIGDSTHKTFDSPIFISTNESKNDKSCQINHNVHNLVDIGVGSNKSVFFCGYEDLVKQNSFKSYTGIDKGTFHHFLFCLKLKKYSPRALR